MDIGKRERSLKYSLAAVLLVSLFAPSAASSAPRVALFARPPYVRAIYDKLQESLSTIENIKLNKNAEYRALLVGANLGEVVKELSSGKRDEQIPFVELKRALASAAIDATPDALTRLGGAAKAELLVVARVTRGKKASTWDLELRLFDVSLKGFDGKPVTIAAIDGKTPAKTFNDALAKLLGAKRSPAPTTARTKRPPFYKQWWFWVIIGGVAAVGTTFAVIGARKTDRLQIHVTR